MQLLLTHYVFSTTKWFEKSILSLKDHDHDMVRGFLWGPLRNEDEKSTFQF